MDADDIKIKTYDLLKGSGINLDYITDAVVSKDAAADAEAFSEINSTDLQAWNPIFGNNPRYGSATINGQNMQGYWFESGSNYNDETQGCSGGNTYFLRSDLWHHTYLGTCGMGPEFWRFDRDD